MLQVNGQDLKVTLADNGNLKTLVILTNIIVETLVILTDSDQDLS